MRATQASMVVTRNGIEDSGKPKDFNKKMEPFSPFHSGIESGTVNYTRAIAKISTPTSFLRINPGV